MIRSSSGGTYTRNTSEKKLTKCQLADDSALLSTTRSGAEAAVEEFQRVGSNFDLSVSIPKSKHMVVGREVMECDKNPYQLVEER